MSTIKVQAIGKISTFFQMIIMKKINYLNPSILRSVRISLVKQIICILKNRLLRQLRQLRKKKKKKNTKM